MAPVKFTFTWNDKSGLDKAPSKHNLFSEAQKRKERPWIDLDWPRLTPDDKQYWETVGAGVQRAFKEAKTAAMRQGLKHATVYWKVPAYTDASATPQQLSASYTISSNPEPSLAESQPRPAQGKGANHYRERPIVPVSQRRAPRLATPPPSLPASVATPHPDVTKEPSPHTPQKSRQSEPRRKKPISPRAQSQVGARPIEEENVFLMGSNLNEEDEDGRPLMKKDESKDSEEQKRLKMTHLLATWDPNVDPSLILFS